MTPEKRNDFLTEVYDFQVIGGNKAAQINRKANDNYREDLSIIKYWEEKGLIHKVSESTGSVAVRLTAHGIDYVEGNLK